MALSMFPIFGMRTQDPIFINQSSLRMRDAPGKKLTPRCDSPLPRTDLEENSKSSGYEPCRKLEKCSSTQKNASISSTAERLG